MAYNPNPDGNRLDQRIDEVTDETLDATRRILQTAEETNKIGARYTRSIQGLCLCVLREMRLS